MSQLLILPDIHGRDFWKEPCLGNVDRYEKVIFLGDYVDPYPFERISVKQSLENFREIVAFARERADKVVTLLGNHDLPYFSDTYCDMLSYHSRMARSPQRELISDLFNENFTLAYTIDGILFTHAGVNRGWLRDCEPDLFDERGHCLIDNAESLASLLNAYTTGKTGLQKLLHVSYRRGGQYEYGSCVWADVNEMQAFHDLLADTDSDLFNGMPQVFGHTQQATATPDGDIVYGKAREIGTLFKMLDTRHAYILDTDDFSITELDNHYNDIIPYRHD